MATKKLIEVALPLEKINLEAEKENKFVMHIQVIYISIGQDVRLPLRGQ